MHNCRLSFDFELFSHCNHVKKWKLAWLCGSCTGCKHRMRRTSYRPLYNCPHHNTTKYNIWHILYDTRNVLQSCWSLQPSWPIYKSFYDIYGNTGEIFCNSILHETKHSRNFKTRVYRYGCCMDLFNFFSHMFDQSSNIVACRRRNNDGNAVTYVGIFLLFLFLSPSLYIVIFTSTWKKKKKKLKRQSSNEAITALQKRLSR